MQKGFIALLLALFLGSGTAYAYDFSKTISGKTLYFNITNSTQHYVEITYPGSNSNPWGGYTKPTGSITLPSTVTYNSVNYTVKAIGDYAFFGCDGLTGTLTIPNTVTTIGVDAFEGCSGFTGLTLGNSVTTIGEGAFGECAGFTGSLTIPNSVTEIGYWAFGYCTGFNGSLTIGNSVTTIDGYAFYQCTGFTGTLTLGNSVTTIGDSAFGGCNGLTGSLTLPNSVTEIGTYAFYSCDGFTGSLVIPNAVVSIGSHAFYGCDGFTGTLTLGSSVTTIGNWAFAYSNFTGSLTIPNSVTTIGDLAFGFSFDFDGTLTIGTGVTSIGESAFKYCDGFTGNLTIPNSVTEIGGTAFSDCSGFTGNLTIGTGVISIGYNAFKNCSGFTQVNYNAINCADVIPDDDGNYISPFKDCSGTLTIGNNVQRIPAWMFYACEGFTGSLTIPNSVTTIGEGAFAECDGFTGTLTLGSSLVTIGHGAFYGCSGFTGSLSIPNSVSIIDEMAFSYCEGFNGTLTIGNSVTMINYGAFYGCTGFIGSLSIPNSVTTIGDYAFEECDDFTGSLTIGNSVTTIGYAAFAYCDGFTGSLSIPNSVTTIGDYAFVYCDGLNGALTIGNSLTTIGDGAFGACSNLTGSLTIPNSVTSIGEDAFYYCAGLNGTLSIGNSVTSIGDEAFYDCAGLTAMTVNPETPPTLGEEVFTNVPTDIPVTVPCSALSDYQTAEGWSDFTNYQCNPTVTVTVVPTAGGTVTGGGTYLSNATVTVTATPNSNYVFMHWTKNGTVVSCNPSYTFSVQGDTEFEAVFVAQSSLGDIIGEGMAVINNQYLPSFSYYKYSMTEQIYTSTEMGGSRTITSISFFNAGATKTRTYDIYMKHTTKTEFSSTTDWVSVTSSYKVFSGSVTMRAGMWTTIVLDTPFSYNGSSNLLLVVDDNTGSFSQSPHMACHSYATSSNQTLRIYSDGTNYNPSGPSAYTGTLMSEKNHIMLNRTAYNIAATSSNTTAGTVSGGGTYGKGDLCTLRATAKSGYTFVSWVDNEGVVVSTDANYSFIVTGNKTLVAHFMSGTDVCSLTFDLHDSYGDGWNGNYLMVNYPNGTTEMLTVPSGANDATFTLPVLDGSHVALSWVEGDWAEECSFVVSYTDGDLLCMETELNGDYTYEFDMDCSGQASEWTYVGDHSTANNYFLPSYSFYCYSLTEQIYTPYEIGEAGLINGIAFYNQGAEKTRNMAIYLATTDKWEFDSRTDWISTSDATLVYSGNVTMHAGKWTPILFNTLFQYDGVSNLVLIVDDNSAAYTSSPHMSCRVYEANDLQAIRIYSDGTDYDPSSSSGYLGTLMSVKNQIMLNITTCEEPMDLTVTDITASSASIGWTSANDNFELRYREAGPTNVYGFEGGLGSWTTIDADGDGYCWYGNSNGYGHNGTSGSAFSASYDNGVLNPDNYLVSPQVTLGGSITFWASAYSSSYPEEHFGVAVSTTNGTNASAFTTIQEWTMTAKGDGAKTGLTRDGGDRVQGTWYQYTVDLSAYAGQRGYVAIRHFNCTDQWRLVVDDITIMQPSTDSWTVVNDPSNPYAITSLMSRTEYEVQVRADCIGGNYTDWASTSFTTLDCEAMSLPYTCGFENENDFSCWAMVNCHNYTGISTNAGHASPHGFSFYYTYTPPQYLISPELTGTGNGVLVEFDYKNRDSDYPETFQVGYSTTDDDIDSFVWESEVTISDEQWSLYSTTFPAGTKYVAVRCNSYDQYCLYLDDFSFTVPDITQTIALAAGWNWVSFNAEITMADLQAALLEAYPSPGVNALVVKSKGDGNSAYNPTANRWVGGLTTLDLSQMYMVKVPTDGEITVEGLPINPADHPATIAPGANWIAFPLSESMSITDAFAGFAMNGDIVKAKGGGQATWNSTANRWIGGLANTPLEPGQGYIYKSASSTPRVLSFAQFEYVDLGLPSGLLWATCNVGADNPEDYGDYFAWGETTTKSDYSWSTYQYCNGSYYTMTKYCTNADYGNNGFVDNQTTLFPEDDAATANWGEGWRMPTYDNWVELYQNTTVTWTTQNGVNGRLFTATNGNSLFLPAAGYRGNSSLYSAGSYGNYWSSSLRTDYPNGAWYFYFSSDDYGMYDGGRYRGFTVRPVCSLRQN